jgi:hypothetical protein
LSREVLLSDKGRNDAGVIPDGSWEHVEDVVVLPLGAQGDVSAPTASTNLT